MGQDDAALVRWVYPVARLRTMTERRFFRRSLRACRCLAASGAVSGGGGWAPLDCTTQLAGLAAADLHGALLDAEILADVYLVMTGGQVNLNINDQSSAEKGSSETTSGIRRLSADRPSLRVIKATESELKSHQQKLETIKNASGQCVWQDTSQ